MAQYNVKCNSHLTYPNGRGGIYLLLEPIHNHDSLFDVTHDQIHMAIISLQLDSNKNLMRQGQINIRAIHQ